MSECERPKRCDDGYCNIKNDMEDFVEEVALNMLPYTMVGRGDIFVDDKYDTKGLHGSEVVIQFSLSPSHWIDQKMEPRGNTKAQYRRALNALGELLDKDECYIEQMILTPRMLLRMRSFVHAKRFKKHFAELEQLVKRGRKTRWIRNT